MNPDLQGKEFQWLKIVMHISLLAHPGNMLCRHNTVYSSYVLIQFIDLKIEF